MAEETASLQAFLRQKDEVSDMLDGVAQATAEIYGLLDESRSAFDPERDAVISARLEKTTREAKALTARSNAALKDMEAQNAKIRKAHGESSSQFQVHRMHYDRLMKLYVDTVKEHQKAKSAFQDVSKDTLKRRARVFFPRDTPEELERRIEESPSDFMQQELLSEEANDQVRATYDEVQSRAHSVQMLAASIREVHEMFADFAALVATQSEQIDGIELVVETAKQRVDKGNTQLEKAIEYQKKIRRRWCFLAVIMAIVLVGVAVVVATQL